MPNFREYRLAENYHIHIAFNPDHKPVVIDDKNLQGEGLFLIIYNPPKDGVIKFQELRSQLSNNRLKELENIMTEYSTFGKPLRFTFDPRIDDIYNEFYQNATKIVKAYSEQENFQVSFEKLILD